jgi:hypothetical protein
MTRMDLSGEEILDTFTYFDIITQFDLSKDVQDFSTWNTEKSRDDYMERAKRADERFQQSLELSRRLEEQYKEQRIINEQKREEERKEEQRREEQRRMEHYIAELAYHSARQEDELNDLRRAIVDTFLRKKELTAAQCANYRYGDPLPE